MLLVTVASSSSEWANGWREQRREQLLGDAKPRGVYGRVRRSRLGANRKGTLASCSPPQLWRSYRDALSGTLRTALGRILKCSLGLQGERTWSLVPPSGLEISEREAPR